MKKVFLKHYNDWEDVFESKLKEFEDTHNNSSQWFEEMAFCVFAANSSAEMGLKAVELLRPHLESGSLEDFIQSVEGKVRFYNVRSEYLYHNKVFLEGLDQDFEDLLKGLDFFERREFIRKNFKGFGMKESSHFLRNIGFRGYAIVDKHVLSVMKDLGVFKEVRPPKNQKEYLELEKKIKGFADSHNLCVDKLDLALWSFRTQKVIK